MSRASETERPRDVPSALDTQGVPECITCGSCCFSTTSDYLRIGGADHERLGDDAESLVEFIGNRAYMRLKDGHCAALTIDAERALFLCSVYERRPDVCRWLLRGSSHCNAERHDKSERPLLALRRSRNG